MLELFSRRICQCSNCPRRLSVVRSSSTLRFRSGNSNTVFRRWYSDIDSENINVAHSRFLADAAGSPGQKLTWTGKDSAGAHRKLEDREIEELPEGKGKLTPASSNLFKLILPLGRLQQTDNGAAPPPPIVFLLHPSQPLSHVTRLIASSLTPFPSSAVPPTVAFRGRSQGGSAFQWADSTDVAHFVRDAGRASEFSIAISPAPPQPGSHPSHSPADLDRTPRFANPLASTVTIDVLVPTFSDRTRFLRKRLRSIDTQLKHMETIKQLCDREAHKGARRIAIGGFGALIVYWSAVARLTFWDYGWDVMEPITYLGGFTTVICGYLWFLYQGHEPSYASLLDRTISSRREQNYKAHGLDIERWAQLIEERKRVSHEISRIEADYHEEVLER